jgi:hypothetical protein
MLASTMILVSISEGAPAPNSIVAIFRSADSDSLCGWGTSVPNPIRWTSLRCPLRCTIGVTQQSSSYECRRRLGILQASPRTTWPSAHKDKLTNLPILHLSQNTPITLSQNTSHHTNIPSCHRHIGHTSYRRPLWNICLFRRTP